MFQCISLLKSNKANKLLYTGWVLSQAPPYYTTTNLVDMFIVDKIYLNAHVCYKYSIYTGMQLI